MKKALFITTFAAVFLLGAEPSAFQAGDLDAPNPYGLTNSEKKIVEQNKNIQSISRNLFDTTQNQTEIKNELDGIKSLLLGHSEKIKKFETRLDGDDNSSLKTLEKKLDDNLKLQNDNYEKIMKTLSALAALLDDTRSNYISKEQLKNILGKKFKVDTKATKTEAKVIKKEPEEKAATEENGSANAAKEETKQANTEVTNQEKKIGEDENKSTIETPKQNNDELLKKAKRLYTDGKLKDAKNAFEDLSKNDAEYQKGLVAFYIAEIDYKNSNYKAALEYYQKSIEADEKASYVPTILFHTAVSLEKLNDKEGAKKILNSLITNYPKHYLTASAKKRLAELK
ncbi:MAG: tetratricopeptide repeat protein [Campylobacterales bacterium]|nr:tetratricopeptide repeat protein [Campylobacterales bacterium]